MTVYVNPASPSHPKLDELIRSVHGAGNEFIGIEHLTADELEEIRMACEDAVNASEDKQDARGRRSKRLNTSFARLIHAKRGH